MKYFVVSDVHSFCNILLKTLHQKGFEISNPDHVLIVCGDLFDRGDESVGIFNFVTKLAEQNRFIYIRGNHEDLLREAVFDIETHNLEIRHHISNGTMKTIEHFTGIHVFDLITGCYDKKQFNEEINSILKFIDEYAVDYYELDEYIFVHGWIPTIVKQTKFSDYNPPLIADFPDGDWNEARWYNGMEFWNRGSRIDGKTIVCGHWHTNYGHSKIDYKCSEWGPDAIFDPFIHDGIIAIDACTAYSKKINCIVIER